MRARVPPDDHRCKSLPILTAFMAIGTEHGGNLQLDQRLLSALADPLSQTSPTHQIRCNGWILTLIQIPGDDLAAWLPATSQV